VVTCYKTGYLPGLHRHNRRYWKHKPTQINVKTPINTKEKTMKTKDEYTESLASELKEWSAPSVEMDN
jgi:hypothetical protein